MKKRVSLAVVASMLFSVLAGVSLYRVSDAGAQDKGLAQQIQGTWALVSIYNEVDGKKSEVFGPDPRGSMIFTPNGRFSITLMRASLPKFAAKNRTKGTAEENQAVVQGSVAFFGSYAVTSEKDNTVNLRVEGSTFPNWDGEDQKRFITVTGDEMSFVTPAAAIGGTNFLVLKRVK